MHASFSLGSELGVHGRAGHFRVGDGSHLRSSWIARKDVVGDLEVLGPNGRSPFAMGKDNAHAALEKRPALGDRFADRRIPR